MKKDFIFEKKSSSSNKPKTIGEILEEILRSNSPLGVAYRKHKIEAEDEHKSDRLFVDIYPDTLLAIDLKLLTRRPGRIPVGTFLDGALTRDSENHFLFVQNAAKERVAARRNPRIYEGAFINVIRRADGSLILTFNRPAFTESFTFQSFCREAAAELLLVAGLIREEDV